MAAMIERLRDEHRNIARLLGALERQIEVFAREGAPDYDVIGGVAAYFLEYPDRWHHPKEDIIFGRLGRDHPTETAAMGDLPHEHALLHDRAVRFSETVRAPLGDTDIARAAVVDAARAFIEAERSHMLAEEQRFFPLAEQKLTPADWSQIEDELASRPDPLFGGPVEERFRTLRERLLAWEAEFRADA